MPLMKDSEGNIMMELVFETVTTNDDEGNEVEE
jgi:hypothetical protein